MSVSVTVKHMIHINQQADIQTTTWVDILDKPGMVRAYQNLSTQDVTNKVATFLKQHVYFDEQGDCEPEWVYRDNHHDNNGTEPLPIGRISVAIRPGNNEGCMLDVMVETKTGFVCVCRAKFFHDYGCVGLIAGALLDAFERGSWCSNTVGSIHSSEITPYQLLCEESERAA